MPRANWDCPNCQQRTLSYSIKRKTWKCWTCGYESNTSLPVPFKVTLREVYKLLQPKSSSPVTLTGNERVSIMKFIYEQQTKSSSDSLERKTIDPWMTRFKS